MQTFIILFRGINLGGKKLLPMKALVPLLKQANFDRVLSYIQSGNVILNSSDNPVEKVQNIVTQHFGFTPHVIAMDLQTYKKVTLNNPYKEFEGKFVHFYFCKNDIELIQDKLEKYIIESETFRVIDNVFYLHAPDGIGRSKLVANIEACLGQSATGRNLNTLNKISLMLGAD
jgi:uncharacterized protein (DUF1697 family)